MPGWQTGPVAFYAAKDLDDKTNAVTLAVRDVEFYLVSGESGGVEYDLGVDSTGAVRANDNPCAP